MSEIQKPNVAVELIRIHKVITRGLEVAIERSQAFAQEGFPDASTQQGFVSYVQALASVLHGHHLTEDDLAFPYFREKLPEMPVEQLSAEHRRMEPILEEIRVALDGKIATATLEELNSALMRIAELWRPHIWKEEQSFDPEIVGALLDVNEQVRLVQQFAQHSQQHGGPDYLVVPFMLYNLSPDDRAAFSQAMPPIVTQQLVPIVWKEKWEPMVPFLLV
jgi:hemerythrin-like domain-containing protein